MEQTATKQLYVKLQQIEFYYQQGDLTITEFIEAKKEAFLQAEETFKQQIIDAYYIGNHCDFRGGSIVKEMGKKYYLKQYAKDTNN